MEEREGSGGFLVAGQLRRSGDEGWLRRRRGLAVVDSPRAIAGQPWRCGAVGAGNVARNQAAVMGWKSARAVADSSSPANCDGAAMRVGCDAAAGLRLSIRRARSRASPGAAARWARGMSRETRLR